MNSEQGPGGQATPANRPDRPAPRTPHRALRTAILAVLVLAGVTVFFWARWIPFDEALLAGLAVLVVACPCGLGVAGALATTRTCDAG